MALISTTPSAISGTSSSNNRFTNPGWVRETMIEGGGLRLDAPERPRADRLFVLERPRRVKQRVPLFVEVVLEHVDIARDRVDFYARAFVLGHRSFVGSGKRLLQALEQRIEGDSLLA